MSETPHISDNSPTTDSVAVSEHPHIQTSPIPVLPELGVALGLLFFVFGVTYIGATNALVRKDVSPTSDVQVQTTPSNPSKQTASVSNFFEDVRLEARSAIVWDVQNQKVLFNKEADVVRPLASITKLMTALVAYELLGTKDTVAITLPALKTEGDSGFTDGETFRTQDLLDLTLITSSNDGAAALGAQAGSAVLNTEDPEAVFVKAMNLKAGEIGLSRTTFKNSTGLDLSENEAGAVGSARDVALLLEHIITHVTDLVELTKLEVTTISNLDGAYHLAKNTNEYVDDIEGLIASKTGYTALSGGNLVVAVNMGLNRPIIVAVLGSSYDGRFTDTQDLVKRARLYVESESQ